MKKKYICACGRECPDITEFRRHLYQFSHKEPGKHWNMTEKNILARTNERLNSEVPPVMVETETINIVPETTKIKAERNVPVKKMVLLITGLLCIAVGLGVMIFGYSGRQVFIIFLGIVILVGGGLLAIRAWKGEGGTMFGGKDLVPADNVIPKPKGDENCLNIYPSPEICSKWETQPPYYGVRFEHMDNPTGIPRKIENFNKWFYFNIWDRGEGKLVPHILPDTRYYSPEVFAQIVVAEPVKRFFEMRWVTLEKIAPWAFVGAIALGLIALIILPGVLRG